MNYSDYISVQKRDGSLIRLDEWQRVYGLEVGSSKIGYYFSFLESRFIRDIEHFGELIVNSILIEVLDRFRNEVCRPVTINSFNRSESYQSQLKERGFKTAKYSPHVVKMAADIDTYTHKQTIEEVKVLEEVAMDLNASIRIGYNQYLKNNQTFIHVDVCPEYYAKGRVFHYRDHPEPWERSARW